jgi:glycosyltransferase involved in cell wall biosynthesis
MDHPMMRADPAASIVMTVHNGGSLLRTSVESALAQTFENYELILVDDGSSDESIETVRHLDPRIVCYRQSHQGASAATQTGLLRARAPVVAFLDQDDLWSPGKLAAQVGILTGKPATILTFSATSYIGISGEDLALPHRVWKGPVDFETLMSDFVIGNTSAIAVRREAALAAGGCDPAFRFMYDLDLCLRMALVRDERIVGDPCHWTYYRRHDKQMSRRWLEMVAEWQRLLAKIADLSPARFARCEARARLNMNRYFAYLAFETGMPIRGLRLLASSLFRFPAAWIRDRRNWLMAAACLAKAILPARAVRRLGSIYRS